MSRTVDVSILTPVHNDGDYIALSLSASLALDTDLCIEVIVIDDGSTDNSADVAQRFAAKDPRVSLIQKPAGGEASALNAGLVKACGKYIAIIEADVEVRADWLKQALPRLEDPEVMGVGGYLLTPPEDSAVARLAGYEIEYRMKRWDPLLFHITSANAMYKREAFDTFGTFREELINSCLDMDFNQRIIASGKKLAFENTARAYHHFKATFVGYIKRQFAYARFRPFLERSQMNRSDTNITVQLILTLMLLASIPIATISVWPFALCLIALFAMQAQMVHELYREKHDPVLFALPPLLICRNIAGLIGLSVGMYEKHIAPSNKNSAQ